MVTWMLHTRNYPVAHGEQLPSADSMHISGAIKPLNSAAPLHSLFLYTHHCQTRSSYRFSCWGVIKHSLICSFIHSFQTIKDIGIVCSASTNTDLLQLILVRQPLGFEIKILLTMNRNVLSWLLNKKHYYY